MQAQQRDGRKTGRARYGDCEKTGAESKVRVQANREFKSSKRMGGFDGDYLV